MTQNKVHHLLAILYLIFEVNITQVSYVIQCIIKTRLVASIGPNFGLSVGWSVCLSVDFFFNQNIQKQSKHSLSVGQSVGQLVGRSVCRNFFFISK